MLKSIAKHLGLYHSLREIYYKMRWKRHLWSDLAHTHLFKSKSKVVTPFGFQLISRRYLANRLMLEGKFETAELDIMKHHLRTAKVFVDVGANIGYYTCLARSLSKYVVAFEPQPRNLECLYANLESNGWSDTEVFPVGLSHSHGLQTLYGASGPSASLIKGWAGYSERFKTIIPVNTMDNILRDRFRGNKLFIKIDVEGAEYDVLKGAQRILTMSPQPTWLIEVCLSEFHPGSLNENYAATFQLFWKHGYEAYLANGQNRLITSADVESWVTAKKTGMKEFNFLFIPKQ